MSSKRKPGGPEREAGSAGAGAGKGASTPAPGTIRKVYRAHSLRLGLNVVRQELGPQAVIISCEQVPSRRDPNVMVAKLTVEAPATCPIERPDADGPHIEVGGLGKELVRIREVVVLPLRYPEMFDRLGISAPKGVLMHGPPGCGKTLIARTLAKESGAKFFCVNGPELLGSALGETEKNLRALFENAAESAPSLIFFDEIDSIAVQREDAASGAERRLVTQLLTLMDGVDARKRILVLAATNRPDAIDPALRRPGRFDREVEIPIPDQEARLSILRIHTRKMTLDPDVELEAVAARTHGFVGADLANVCKEAALQEIHEAMPEGDETVPPKLVVCMRHFETALKDLKPSSLREVSAVVSKVTWADVGGLEQVKKELTEAIVVPLKRPELFERMHIRPSKGILLAGPPGTGKTLIARAAAGECGVNFIPVNGPSLVSKYVGESEKGVREVFEQARKAKPCIIFFDEFDSLVPVRGSDSENQQGDRMVAQFLVELDGFSGSEGVFCLAATNRPDAIDPAVRRPGRFDKVIEIPLPDNKSRMRILRVHLADKPLERTVNFEPLIRMTEGFSGAEIEEGCRRAAMAAVRKVISGQGRLEPAISERDLIEAISEVAGAKGKQTASAPPRPRALVVATEKEDLENAAQALKATGLLIDRFGDAEEAVAATAKAHYDLAVIDVTMTRIDELQLLSRVRSGQPNLPIIVAAERKRASSTNTYFRLGAVQYLDKPYAAKDLANSIREVLAVQSVDE